MYKIMFDYGHGGSDSGATYNGWVEKNDVLGIGMAIAQYVRNFGVQVDETRTSDRFVSLQERCDIENSSYYDYFISFHRNDAYDKYGNRVGEGVEVYTLENPSNKTKTLAKNVLDSLVNLGFKNRGLKTENYKVLRGTKCSAILVELGFIHNTNDNNLFCNKYSDIVEAVGNAILKTLGISTDKPPVSNETNTFYRVLVGSFKNRSNAENLKSELNQKGYNASISIYEGGK